MLELKVTPSNDVAPPMRIGMITPSSNTALEPLTSRILADYPSISAHYARIRVTEISITAQALAQFDATPMIEAASLLADARLHALVWNGTSGGWRGFDADRRLCSTLEDRFAIPVTTVTLALRDVMHRSGIRRIAFVTPYTEDVQARILATFSGDGFSCTHSPCLGIAENFAFSQVSEERMDEMVRRAAADRPDVIIPYCTNLPATPLVSRWEAEHGIPVFDSIALATYAGIRLAGQSPGLIEGWGRLFRM